VNGRVRLAANSKERAMLTSIVNPCNPTGDYMSLPELKAWIDENVQDGGVVLVGEMCFVCFRLHVRSDKNPSGLGIPVIWTILLYR
jgi:hypothetical protein